MYVKTVGPIGAKLFFVGEAPGEQEDKHGTPFRIDAPAGKTFTNLLVNVGISRAECLIGNVAKERPPANKISYFFEDSKCTIPKPIMQGWINELKREIEFHQPNIVVALGNIALWALTGQKKISEFRGAVMESVLVPGQKIVATYHPSAINHQWELYWTVVMDLRKAKYHSGFRSLPTDKRVLLEARSPSDFISFCEGIIENKEEACLDIETVQPRSHISILGVAASPNLAMSIRLISGPAPTFNQVEEAKLWHTFATLCRECPTIFQNAPYDTGVLLLNHSIHCRKLAFDTLLAAHVLWPETPRDLGYLASICLDVPAWKHTSKDNAVMYNAADCANTFGIKVFMEKELEKLKLLDLFKFELSEVAPSLMMQLQGIEVDREVQKELVEDATSKYQLAEAALNKIVGRKINYRSTQQMQQLLYVDMKLPIQFKRRKRVTDPRKVTVGAEAIKKLKTLAPNNPLFNLLLEYKKYVTLVKFLDTPISPQNRVHTSYNIAGSLIDEDDTKSQAKGKKSFGRWSSSKSIILPYGSGNLQNIPPEARKMFRARKGWVILQADKVQAEAVVVAFLSNNQKEKNLFKNRLKAPYKEKGKFDVHKLTAAGMFHMTIEEVTKEHRVIGKTLRHAVSYFAGPGVVAAKLGIKLTAAKGLLQTYFNANPSLVMWHRSIQEELRSTRTLTNVIGRSHKFLGRWGDDLLRSAYAFKPQSSVGDLLNMDLVEIYEEAGSDIEILLQLHDAIYFHLPETMVDEVQKLCLRVMLRPIEVNHDTMVIEADFKVGDSWGEQEELPFEV